VRRQFGGGLICVGLGVGFGSDCLGLLASDRLGSMRVIEVLAVPPNPPNGIPTPLVTVASMMHATGFMPTVFPIVPQGNLALGRYR
jgi:hypothetical protein